jgi:Ser/Thr protein kinase RdoA (MazF antagonist)
MPPADADEDPHDLAAVRALLADYSVGEVIVAGPLAAGSDRARQVVTAGGSYVLKPAYRMADVELYAQVAAQLTARGIRQPRVEPTRSGGHVTSSGYFLQELLPGVSPSRPTPAQTAAAMRHVAAYHLALGELALGYEPDHGSIWVRVTDPGFLLAELPGLLASHGLADPASLPASPPGSPPGSPVDAALDYLRRSRPGLAALPRQLVHGDIGPDNFLMAGDDVVALIDFTPHWQPVLFAAATALYWFHVYGQPHVSAGQLRASMATMAELRPWTEAELALWPASLVLEALRRLATPLELARERGGEPGPGAGERLAAAETVARLLPALTDAGPG